MNKIIMMAFLIFLSGCSHTTEVLKVGPGTYSVTATVPHGFGGIVKAKEKVQRLAVRHCDSLNKEIRIVKSTNIFNGFVENGIDIVFFCLDKEHPALYERFPNFTIERRDR